MITFSFMSINVWWSQRLPSVTFWSMDCACYYKMAALTLTVCVHWPLYCLRTNGGEPKSDHWHFMWSLHFNMSGKGAKHWQIVQVQCSGLKLQVYPFVHRILEYTWTKETIGKIEAIQRQAARFVANHYHNTYSVQEMISNFEWPSLQHYRKVATLSMMYKIPYDQVIIDNTKLISALPRQRRRHSRQLAKFQCHSVLVCTRASYSWMI